MDPKDIHSLQEAYLGMYQDIIVEEFKDLTPEKKERVENRVNQLASMMSRYNSELQQGITAVKKRKANPIANALLGTRGPKRRLKALLDRSPQIEKYQQHSANAMGALTRTHASREASTIYKINQTKEKIRKLGGNPDVPSARSNIRRFKRTQSESYNILISHLLDEGYANTPETAHLILENMSEGWIDHILENFYE